MTLRIVEVEASGLKLKSSKTRLSPVQLIVGPNGSGKSAVLEAIHYAFTGHVAGVKTTELGVLFPDPKNVSIVVHAADDETDHVVSVSRGVQSGKKYARGRAFARQTGTSHEAKDASRIDSFVVDEFGARAELFLDAFDPEKNIWSLSAEARLRWTFGVVAGASGWTKDRLKGVLKDLGHGNADFGRDVVECLDLNIKTASEWMKSTAKAVREYEAILAGLTDAISEPKPEEIEAAKKEVKELRDRFSKSEGKIRRDALVKQIADAEADAVKCAAATEQRDELLREFKELALERVDRKKDVDDADVRRRALQRHHGDIAVALQAVEENGACPTCGATYEDQAALNALTSRWLREQRERELEIERLGTIVSTWDAGAKDRKDKDYEIMRRDSALLELGAYPVNGRAEIVTGLENGLADLKKRLVTMEGDQYEEPATVRAKLEEAEAKLEDITNRQQLAKERAKKTADRDKADEAAVLRKKQHEELCDVRASIMNDARRQVAGAIDHEIDDVVAPHGGHWLLDLSDETGIDIAYRSKAGVVKYKAMSSGERIVATVVLLTALRRLIGPTPWSALLVDNLELTSYQERMKLVAYVSSLVGLFSNIILLSSDNRPLGSLPMTVFE